MNIFLTHQSPQEAAKYLVDLDIKRAKKMLIESVQIASYAISKLHNVEPFYKMQGNKSPAFWVMQDDENLKWLIIYINNLDNCLSDKDVYVCDRKHRGNLQLCFSFLSWAIPILCLRISIFLRKKFYITPACLCERSSIIKYQNNCTVYEAYKMLLDEKINKG